jgi:hypothetical protein
VLSVLRYTDSDYLFGIFILYKLLKLFSGTMVAAVLKFGGSLTPSDPQKNAVVIIGQPRYLSKINFSDVKMKLEPRVIVDRSFSFCPFSFGHCVVCSSIYGF